MPASSGSCAAWLQRGRALDWPVSEGAGHRIQPAAILSPVDAGGFPMLQELGPLPESIRALLH